MFLDIEKILFVYKILILENKFEILIVSVWRYCEDNIVLDNYISVNNYIFLSWLYKNNLNKLYDRILFK